MPVLNLQSVIVFVGVIWYQGFAVVFVLDNYDSFTYNLVQYLGELGAEVEVRRNDQVTVAEVDAMRPERVVISPGPCTPHEAGISVDLIRHFAGKAPVLGVCLGHQAIGEAFGGRVVRAANLMHGKTSAVVHDNRTVFRGLPMPMTATRYHSLMVEEKGSARGFGSQRMDHRKRWKPHHHGTAPPPLCGRGRAVSSGKRADRRGKKAGRELPEAVIFSVKSNA